MATQPAEIRAGAAKRYVAVRPDQVVPHLFYSEPCQGQAVGVVENAGGWFKHGGWAIPYHDEGLAKSVADSMAATDAYLFGRKTFENFAAYRPTAGTSPLPTT